MSDFATHDFDSDADRTPLPAGKLSSNGQWIFGSVFAGLILIGFSFGVWAGASKPKPVEVAEVKKDNTERPPTNPPPVVVKPPVTPVVDPKPVDPDPKRKEPDPKPKEPDPKPKEPDPKPKEPDPKPKPKLEFKEVAFKEIQPILRVYCGNCHGDTKKIDGGVDLRTVLSIKKGAEGGLVILIPGDPAKSALYESITDARMPKGKKGPNPAELKLIHDWIASGAKERRRTVRGRRGMIPAGAARRPGYSPKT